MVGVYRIKVALRIRLIAVHAARGALRRAATHANAVAVRVQAGATRSRDGGTVPASLRSGANRLVGRRELPTLKSRGTDIADPAGR